MEKNSTKMKIKSKFELKSYPIVEDEIAPRPISINNKKQAEQLPATAKASVFKLDREKSQYLKDIDKCQEALNQGESYEICLTNSFHKSISKNISPRKFYRSVNQSHLN